jgi:hypothetical protein
MKKNVLSMVNPFHAKKAQGFSGKNDGMTG